VGEVERVNRGRARVIPVNRADGEIFNPYDVSDLLVRTHRTMREKGETADFLF